MSKFKAGDWVRMVSAKGLEDIPTSSRPRLQSEAYKVLDVSTWEEAIQGAMVEYIKLAGHEKLGWWAAWRFESLPPSVAAAFDAPFLGPNPCAEVPVSTEVDWKARYEKLHEQYLELEGANILNRGAVRLQRQERAVEHERLLGAQARVRDLQHEVADLKESIHKMDRQTFIGSTYNWARKGLTWEEAARDLFNYILQSRGEQPLPKTAKLIPPRTFHASAAKVFINDKLVGLIDKVTYSLDVPDRAFPPYHNPRKAENNCPDKMEPCSHRGERCNHPPSASNFDCPEHPIFGCPSPHSPKK